jgi:hypothetical protein
MNKNRTHFIFLFLLFPLLSAAQALPNYNFTNTYQDTCAYDTAGTTVINFVTDWEGYLSMDSTWTGPHDSVCVDLAPFSTFGIALPLPQLNVNRPLYIRSLLDSVNEVALDSNALYKVFVSQIGVPGPLNLIEGDTCKEDFCNGMRIGIRIPDSAGTGSAMRWYTGYEVSGGNTYEFCFPTEKFVNENHIREAFLKYFQESVGNTGIERLYSVQLEDMTWSTNKFTHIDATFPTGTSYAYYMSAFNWPGPNYMAMYHDTTYPNPFNISFIDVDPPPSAVQETVEVVVEPGAFFIQQPYTALRGGLVTGDTIRHIYNLINDGGTVCLYMIVELLFENGNGFMYRSGNVNFEGKTSCMLFGNGGKLMIPDQTRFDYGATNRGMLALRPGGVFQIGKGSELVIHNVLSLKEYRNDINPADLSVTLGKGSKLTFAPGSHITTMGTAFPGLTFLKVYMQGGILDDSGLDAASKSLIIRVYDNPVDELSDNLTVFNHPFDEMISLSMVVAAEMQMQVNLFDVKGAQLASEIWNASKGISYFDLPADEIAHGIYILKIETPLGVITRRLCKQ